jgi:hypothetical protein
MPQTTQTSRSISPSSASTCCRTLGLWVLLVPFLSVGCTHPAPQYGREATLTLATPRAQVWAIAPAINLSGQKGVDALLQADSLYQQLQQVKGLTVIPVDRVIPVYLSLRLEKVQSPAQAALVCDLLGCDALLVPTVTAYDPYDPPKMGASLQLFPKPSNYTRPTNLDPRELARAARPPATTQPFPSSVAFPQVVGMFDAANGTTHADLMAYAHGRFDPKGPLKEKEFQVSMDRYTGFVYRKLIEALLDQLYDRAAAQP